jgi:phosphoglycerate dehydrogenase-like enzyme
LSRASSTSRRIPIPGLEHSKNRRIVCYEPNFIAAPHVAGVTREAVDRMGVAAVRNILSVLDGKPIRDNVVNKEVLD